MSALVDELTGRSGERTHPPDVGQRLQVAVAVSAPWDADSTTAPGEHFDTCINLARDAARALQQRTGDLSAPPTRQQLLPLYLVVDEDHDGNRAASQMVVMDDTYFGASFAEPGVAQEAQAHLAAALSYSPVETYHDMWLGARRAYRAEGNYVDAVLGCAAACEVLIKHTAAMLTWEAQQPRVPTGPHPPRTRSGTRPNRAAGAAGEPSEVEHAPGGGNGSRLTATGMSAEKVMGARPGTLIGKVLAPNLGGSWVSRDVSTPIGAWRHDVARMRSRVIHRGYRPTETEASAALEATQRLETHVMDRLASKSQAYPRSALLLAGRDGLERRGRYAGAEAVWETESLAGLMWSYNTWLDAHDIETEDD